MLVVKPRVRRSTIGRSGCLGAGVGGRAFARPSCSGVGAGAFCLLPIASEADSRVRATERDGAGSVLRRLALCAATPRAEAPARALRRHVRWIALRPALPCGPCAPKAVVAERLCFSLPASFFCTRTTPTTTLNSASRSRLTKSAPNLLKESKGRAGGLGAGGRRREAATFSPAPSAPRSVARSSRVCLRRLP